ncbi:YitT family protein [Bacillus sp. N1-1]|jgi:uncharacterized membrane-anchored protein YitT (DUF2179 family)|uniref:YitT family protein n=1 Tax=Bacillus sp. N1-1 TaxID=2682541 RepID=UPI001318929F|nr:YitT family protein [Bacillus sp. N1-1]QHA90372.1 DUF2179 domain-containing protein [Bacillus sp. N1-1]
MLHHIKTYLLITLGALGVATHVHFFLSPNSLATGGVSGLSILMNHLVPNLSVGMFMIILNAVLLLVGILFLGPKFGVKTIYASFALSLAVWAFERFIPVTEPFSQDILIQLIIGQCIAAAGMGLVFHQKASTGGTDIIAMILNKFFSMEVGKAVLVSDISIALFSVVLFGPEIGMYAIFGVILNGLVIDYTLQSFEAKKEIVIISKESEEIRSFIVEVIGKGATIHTARGAFTSDEKEVITTILGRKDLLKLKKHVGTVDQKAFITVHSMKEILGQDFKSLA